MDDEGKKAVVLTHSLHASNLLHALDASRKKLTLCDGVVIIGGEEIPVQKNVLVAASPYFRAMFDYDKVTHSEQATTHKHVVDILDLTRATFEEILDYIYTSRISLSEDNIQDILQAADILLLKDLKDLCCDFLEGCITVNNCLGIRDFSERFSCPRVHFLASEYLDENFVEISYSEEFLLLSAEQVQEVLSRDSLNVPTENYVFDGLMRWAARDSENRSTILNELLMSTLRHDMLNKDAVLSHQLVLQNEVLQKLKVLLNPHHQGRVDSHRGYSDVLVVAGGQQPRGCPPGGAVVSDKVYCIQPSVAKCQWLVLPPMSTGRVGHGLVSAGGCLYAVGGKNESGQILNTGEKFDPVQGTWHPIPKMSHARVGFGLLAINDKIYAIGGSNDMSDPLTSIEEYNIYTNRWRPLPNMNLKRAWSAFACLGKKLYVIGGGIMGKLYESVECFDIKTETWSSIAPMRERRFDARAVGVDCWIFVFGGLRRFECPSAMNTGNQMKFCGTEMYSQDAQQWYSLGAHTNGLCSMKDSSHVDGAAPCNGEILCVGELEIGTTSHCVRAYHPSSQRWRCVMPSSPAQLQFMQCCSIKIPNSVLKKLPGLKGS